MKHAAPECRGKHKGNYRRACRSLFTGQYDARYYQNRMKLLFSICVIILLYACDNPDRSEHAVLHTRDYLHDIAPYTLDSLVQVVIEIPAGTNEKWEVNKISGQIEWEQVPPDSFRVVDYLPYPANYGFVPQTLLPRTDGGDGDAVDVFVLGPSIARAEIVTVRIVGVIHMLDDNTLDSKLLAVHTDAPVFDIASYEMLINAYPGVIDIIKLWLMNYKGPGSVDILAVEDETGAMHFLRTAHLHFINRKNR
jgi:inorganic pyrophosphatase